MRRLLNLTVERQDSDVLTIELEGGEVCITTAEQRNSIGIYDEDQEDEFENSVCSRDPDFEAAWRALAYCEYVEGSIDDDDSLATFNMKVIQKGLQSDYINDAFDDASDEEIQEDANELICIAAQTSLYIYGYDETDDDSEKIAKLCQFDSDLGCDLNCLGIDGEYLSGGDEELIDNVISGYEALLSYTWNVTSGFDSEQCEQLACPNDPEGDKCQEYQAFTNMAIAAYDENYE